MKKYLSAAAIGVLALGTYWYSTSNNGEATGQVAGGAPLAHVNLPASLTENAQAGRAVFAENCAACHGTNADGRDGLAPPLVHIIYEPNHHGDESFQRAVALGVRQHHWPFGNMPAVQGLNRKDVESIIAYVRELQVTNGIN